MSQESRGVPEDEAVLERLVAGIARCRDRALAAGLEPKLVSWLEQALAEAERARAGEAAPRCEATEPEGSAA
jgi:hypothetical protein